MTLLPLRVFCGLGLLATLTVGVHVARNFQQYFGVDPSAPSETGGQRFYNKAQMISVWIFTVLLFGMMVAIL